MDFSGTHVDNHTLIVFGVIGGILISIAAYYIIRFMKGTIKLSLPRTSFNPGEKITGNFELLTKKDIEGNKLLVSIIGLQTTTSYRNGKRRSHTEEVYRDQVIVEEARSYPSGYVANYSFSIPVPDFQKPEQLRSLLNSTIGETLATAVQFLGSQSSPIKWKIEVRLDAKGVDLATSKPVYFNSKQAY
jgi:hypothetical protein